MVNTNPLGVNMPVGTARDLRVFSVAHVPAAHAAAAWAAAAVQRKRGNAAATQASVDWGIA